MVDAIYRRLIERDFALEGPQRVVMLLTALINILGARQPWGDRPTEVLLMAAYGERGSTRPPEHESDEVEKTGLSQGVDLGE